MANNKNKNKQDSKKSIRSNTKSWHDDLHPETKKSILAIVAFLFAAIFLLSYLGKAGAVGGYTFKILNSLFGKGYFFAPIVSIMAGFSFIFSFKRRLYFATILGAVIFLISSLSLVEIIFGGKTGGYIGYIASYPMLRLFDFWASLIIASSLFIVSLLLTLNVPIFRTKNFDEPEKPADEAKEAETPEEAAGTIKTLLENINNTVKDSLSKKESANNNVQSKPAIMQDAATKASANDEIFIGRELRLKKSDYSRPPLALLANDKGVPSSGDIKANANVIARTLENFGIDVDMGEVSVGPTVTQYTLKPAEGVKLSKITALHNNLALALAAHPIRIEAPIPGKSLVGIEIPNKSISLVGLRSLLEHEVFEKSHSSLLFVLGRDVTGSPIFADLARMPHLLIAGATGTGKSVSIHTIITSFLYRNSPETLRFIIIDPKRVELSIYNDIPHLLTPVITDAKKIIQALRWAVKEMERRYDILSQIGARDILGYNNLIGKNSENEKEPLPYLVIVIDELADIMLAFPREVEASIIRLAQMARAVGIHLIVSTQRPSVEVITGLIKANITSRIAFQVASQVDSRTILDMAGAEKLLGNGDMLFLAGDTAKPRRIQGAFISEAEIKKMVDFLREAEEPEYEEIFPASASGASQEIFNDSDIGDEEDDELYEEAKKIVVEAGKASASYLQRRLRVGYARAARLLDMLEEEGVIGPGEGAKPRDILIKTAADNYEE